METLTASPSKKEIVMALARVQGAIQNPKKDTDNPFFKSKYADLSSVCDSVRALLAANDLAFVQHPTSDGNKVSVTGVLMHSSGESIESTISACAKDALPQSIGSAITYLRRYQISAILGIAAEADDDGNAASGNNEKPKSTKQERPTFAGAPNMEQHEAAQAAKATKPAEPKAGTTTRSQTDLGSFEDRIKFGKIASEGKRANGVPWTLYTIETEGHGPFSTFSATVFEDAVAAAKSGATIMVHTEPTPKGPKINGIEFMGETQQKAA